MLRPRILTLKLRMIAFFAALILICFARIGLEEQTKLLIYDHGAIIRGDTGEKKIALVFTGHEFADGGEMIRRILKTRNAKSSFFFTGDFYRSPANAELISGLAEDGHYLGPHSDKHLLYCSWEDREKLLVMKDGFRKDILDNYKAMEMFGIKKNKAPYFIPPYEWYSEAIVAWARELGITVINFTPGTLSNADYTTPEMPNYRSSDQIYKSIMDYEESDPNGLKGFILLIHIGTHSDRNDKFYKKLERLMEELEAKGYVFVRVDSLLQK